MRRAPRLFLRSVAPFQAQWAAGVTPATAVASYRVVQIAGSGFSERRWSPVATSMPRVHTHMRAQSACRRPRVRVLPTPPERVYVSVQRRSQVLGQGNNVDDNQAVSARLVPFEGIVQRLDVPRSNEPVHNRLHGLA